MAEFYPPLKICCRKPMRRLKIVIEDEVSDIPAKMRQDDGIQTGRYGRFLACPGFPDCRNTMPILTYIDAPCPKCGARLLEKTSRKNRKFYGCEKYPDCDFVSWDMPVDKSCPKCGSYMILKRRKAGNLFLCANETCRHSEPADDQQGDDEP